MLRMPMQESATTVWSRSPALLRTRVPGRRSILSVLPSPGPDIRVFSWHASQRPYCSPLTNASAPRTAPITLPEGLACGGMDTMLSVHACSPWQRRANVVVWKATSSLCASSHWTTSILVPLLCMHDMHEISDRGTANCYRWDPERWILVTGTHRTISTRWGCPLRW